MRPSVAPSGCTRKTLFWRRGIGITVYCDGSKGTGSTTELSKSSIEATVRKALSIASYTETDAHAGLADAELMGRADAPLDLYHPWELEVDKAREIALEAEDAARSADDRIENSEGANVSTDSGYRAYANSHGFSGGHATSSHSISCSVIAAGNAELERDYWVSSARASTDLDSAQSVGLRSAQEPLAKQHASLIIASVSVPWPD